jgi:hypothetical protein
MYMYHASFPLMFLALPLLFLLLFNACQHFRPQAGHQIIAAAVRQLLETSYAGIDYLTYHDSLRAVEAVADRQLESTPDLFVPQWKKYLLTSAQREKFCGGRRNMVTLKQLIPHSSRPGQNGIHFCKSPSAHKQRVFLMSAPR